jgi:CspA family cold shock protein
MTELVVGKVKWWNQDRGYGFIQAESLGKDVFVHIKALKASGIHNPLLEGEQVRFICKEHDKGLFAENLSRVDGAVGAQK